MLISEFGTKVLKNGTMATKRINELINTNYTVEVSCDNCNTIYKTLWNNRQTRVKQNKNDLCKSCAYKGVHNSQYKKDRKELCRVARSFLTVNPMKNKFHSLETRKKMSEIRTLKIANNEINITSNNRGRKGWYYSYKNKESFYYDSLLEKLRMVQLDKDEEVIEWTKKHKIKIKYKYQDTERLTVPDFLIIYKNGDVFIEELKGWLQDIDIVKKEATESYCIENKINYKFTTQKELNKNGEYRAFIKKEKKGLLRL